MIHTPAEVEAKYRKELAMLLDEVDTLNAGSHYDIDAEDVTAVERAVEKISGRMICLGFNAEFKGWFLERVYYVRNPAKDSGEGYLAAVALALVMCLVLILAR